MLQRFKHEKCSNILRTERSTRQQYLYTFFTGGPFCFAGNGLLFFSWQKSVKPNIARRVATPNKQPRIIIVFWLEEAMRRPEKKLK